MYINEQFVKACEKEDAVEIKRLLNSYTPPDVNYLNALGFRKLVRSLEPNLQIISYLLIRYEISDDAKLVAIRNCCMQDKVEVLKLLEPHLLKMSQEELVHAVKLSQVKSATLVPILRALGLSLSLREATTLKEDIGVHIEKRDLERLAASPAAAVHKL